MKGTKGMTNFIILGVILLFLYLVGIFDTLMASPAAWALILVVIAVSFFGGKK